MLKKYNIILDNRILTIKPLGFFDFLKLEKDCFLTITDSGTVQEESAILKKPCLIIREYTERLETIKAGSATLLGNNTKKILTKINFYLKNNIKIKNIKDYQNKNVSSKIIKIMKK